MLNRTTSVQERVDWLRKGNPDLIGARVENGNLAKAAMALDAQAKIRGLKIVKVARFWRNNVDCAFALGEA
jgi:hypothetical protein